MKKSVPAVAALMVMTTSLLTGCSTTSSPAATSSTPTSPQVKNPTQSPGTQSPTKTPQQATPSPQEPPSAVPPTSARNGAAPCQTAHLSLAQGRVGMAAGSVYVTYYLRNQGPGTCSMLGYPGFSFLSGGGALIQHPATRDVRPHQLVLLQPGQRVQFVVRTVDASIDGTGCAANAKTAQVQVYPPNQRTPIRAPSSVAACDLSVGPVSVS